MKTAICGIIFLVIFYASAYASANTANTAEVHAAQLNNQTENIEVDITYSACHPHNFEMQMKSCTRSKPANCVAELVDLNPPDACRAFITERVEIPAADFLQNRHVGRLVIIGSEQTAAQVDLSSEVQ